MPHEEIIRLYFEEGIHDIRGIAECTGYSQSNIYRILRKHRMQTTPPYQETGEPSHTNDSPDNVDAPIPPDATSEKLSHHNGKTPVPALITTGEILRRAAQEMLQDVAENGISDRNVKSWMTLANAYESFRTQEYRIEMALAGMEEFAAFVHTNAKDLHLSPEHIRTIIQLVDSFRKEKSAQLRAQIQATA